MAVFSFNEGYALSYNYDMFGRFHSVTSSISSTTSAFTYSYLAGTDLLSGMTASSGFLWTRAYESGRSLITSVENRFGETVISRYDYENDALGRRVSRADSGEAFTFTNSNDLAAFNLYGYNGRSEVASSARYWGTDTGDTSEAVDGQQYAYAYDPVGNRITAAEGDTDRTATYTANALNQYTQRTVPGVKELAGTAITNATVTVNGLATDRHGPWWRHAFEVDNASSAAYAQAVVTAVYNPPGTNDPDVVTSQTGRVFVAQTPEGFTYDDDGNLTRDGRFTYTWNGENRLIKAETRNDLPVDVPRVKVEYAYDHQGRMVWKKVSTNAVVLSTRNLVWDNYNIVRETIHSTVPSFQSSTNLYVWGLDLSGSLQGAGGIGGLLAVTTLPTADCQLPTAYFPFYDANGNVTEYVDDSGSLAAHYEYSPFGETVVQSGDMAQSFTHRFSTKPWCEVTGLTEYEFRKYGPGTGRWLSRDPFDEMGGVLHRIFSAALSSVLTMLDNALISLLAEDINPDDPLYVFVENSVLDLIDPQGLSSSCPFGCVNGRCPKPPPYAPEENGCGPGWATWISDAPVQGCSFLEACNKHDRCYGTCNAGKGRCDKEFKNDMLDACNRCSFNETTERVRIGRRGRGGGWRRRVVTEEAWRRRCRSTARLYASAVRMPIVSHASYTEGQNDGCENCSCEEGQQRDAWPPIDDDFDSPQPVPIIKIPW